MKLVCLLPLCANDNQKGITFFKKRTLPYSLYIVGHIDLGKQCKPRSEQDQTAPEGAV